MICRMSSWQVLRHHTVAIISTLADSVAWLHSLSSQGLGTPKHSFRERPAVFDSGCSSQLVFMTWCMLS